MKIKIIQLTFKSLKKIIRIITVSKISLKYALAKFYIIDFALKGVKDPINKFTKKFNKDSLFKVIFEKILKCDVSSHFENADKDGNGVLDLEEFLEFVVREPNVYKYLEETVNTAQLMIEETRKNYLSSIFDTVPVDDSGNPRRPSLCDIKVRKI